MNSVQTPPNVHTASGTSRPRRLRVRRPSRRGLSPLELTLSLPILLFIMALMINYGTVASWDVRGLVMARHAMWQSRALRSASLVSQPRPAYWPTTASINYGGAGNVPSLDDARVNLPTVRGPTLTIPRASGLSAVIVVVNSELLDPTRGLHTGAAELERKFPLLASLGMYHLASHQHLLDNKWGFRGMNLTHDYNYRSVLRLDALYRLPKADSIYSQRYVQAITALWTSPCWAALRVLDHDPELLAVARRGIPIPTDFHPGFQSPGPTLDKDLVAERVKNLIEHIAEVPDRMERVFHDLYAGVYDQQ